MVHGHRWVPVRIWALLAAAVLMLSMVGPRAMAEPNPDTTDAIALTFKDADIALAIEQFEKGEHQQAIERLSDLIKDKARSDAQRVRELRAAMAMLQVRSGDNQLRAQALTTLANLGNLNGETDLARRAQVIRMTADTKIKEGTSGIADLRPRENWIEQLRQVKRYLENRIDEQHDRIDRCIDKETWDGLRDGINITTDHIEQLGVIQLETNGRKQIVARHAEFLRAAARSINDRIKAHAEQADELKGRMRRSDHKGDRAKFRGQANKAVDRARNARSAGEKVVDAYRDLRKAHPELPPLGVELRSVPAKVP